MVRVPTYLFSSLHCRGIITNRGRFMDAFICLLSSLRVPDSNNFGHFSHLLITLLPVLAVRFYGKGLLRQILGADGKCACTNCIWNRR